MASSIRRALLSWSPTPSRIALISVAFLVVTMTSLPTADAGGPGRGAVYVALGDSYAAGEGLGGFEVGTNTPPSGKTNTNRAKNTCHRSLAGAYASLNRPAPLVQPAVPTTRRSFWACSGARTTDILHSQGALPIGNNYYQASQPAQALTVDARTRWISVSVGGNDVGFSDVGRACASYTTGRTTAPIPGLSSVPCATAITAATKKLPALRRDLVDVYKSLLDKAPQAVLAVVGYPRVFPSDYTRAYRTRDKRRICLTNVVYTDSENGAIAAVGVDVDHAKSLDSSIIGGLNTAAKAAIAELKAQPLYEGRIVFADSYASSVPQNCSGVTPGVSVNGVVLSLGARGTAPSGWGKLVSSATFHPTKAGQTVMGKAVQAAFNTTVLRYAGGAVQVGGVVGKPLTATATLIAGVRPFTATAGLSGQVPRWLTVGVTGQTVTVAGTPEAEGHWSFGVTIEDAHGDTAVIPVVVTIKAAGGTVWAWGHNDFGTLGNGTKSSTASPVPAQVPGLSSVTAVSGGPDTTYALTAGGDVWAWGGDSGFNDGQLGNGTWLPSNTPVKVTGLTGVTAVAGGGGRNGYALRRDGTVWAWGGGSALGSTLSGSNTPVQIKTLPWIVAISGGYGGGYALDVNGWVWAWGSNAYGRLGHGDSTTFSYTPVRVGDLKGVTAIAGSGFNGYALGADGTIWGWGLNNLGQVGDGTKVNKFFPNQVVGLNGVIRLAGGSGGLYALRGDGTVWGWGENGLGELGNGTTANSATPVRVLGLSAVTAVAAGGHTGIALRGDGTVWSWGYNNSGNISAGDPSSSNLTPVQVRGLSTVTNVGAGVYNGYAVVDR
jgi:alpha-tubulin suppressor-like RCC1 family protein